MRVCACVQCKSFHLTTCLCRSREEAEIGLQPINYTISKGWVVSTTTRPPYSLERPGTHCTGSWVGRGTGRDGHGKSPDRPSRSESLTDYAIPAAVYVCMHVCECCSSYNIYTTR